MAHVPDVQGPDGKKLSKRHGSTAVSEFKEQGYLPEALVNFLALIGWSPGTEEEVFSMDDLIRVWRIEKVQHGGAKWDKDRLDYFNGVWIRRLPEDELVRRLRAFVPPQWDDDLLRKVVPLIRERMKTLAEAKDQIAFLFTETPEYPPSLAVPKQQSVGTTVEALSRAASALRDARPFDARSVESALRGVADGWSVREFTHAVRVAVTGRTIGPPLFESIELLGRERTLQRIERAQSALRG